MRLFYFYDSVDHIAIVLPIPILYTGADPYCIVTVGKQKAVTPVQKNTLDPNFNSKVMFFISNPVGAEVTVEVCSCGDNLLCTCLSR